MIFLKIFFRNFCPVSLFMIIYPIGLSGNQYPESDHYQEDDFSLNHISSAAIMYSSQYKNYPEITRLILKGIADSRRGDREAALQNYLKASELCKKNKFEIGLADCELLIGEIYYSWGEYDIALRHFLEARSKAGAIKYLPAKASSINYIGKYYHSIGNFNRSYEKYKEGLQIAFTINDSLLISELLKNIGNYFSTIGNASLALENLIKSLKYADQKINPFNYASSCSQLANVYQDRKQLDKAEYYHKKALELRISLGDKEETGKSLKNLGEVYEELGKIDSAKYFYSEALLIFKDISYMKGQIKCYNNLGRVYCEERNYPKSEDNLFKALHLSEEVGYQKGIVNAKKELGKLFLDRKQFIESSKYLEEARSDAEKYGILYEEKDILFQQYLLFKQLEEYQKALHFFQKYAFIEDSIKEKEFETSIESLAIEYESRKNEQENKILKGQNELQLVQIKTRNKIILIGLFALFSVVIAGYSIYRNLINKNRDNKKLVELNRDLKTANEKLEITSRERDRLYSIFAHELRNPLLWFKNITGKLNSDFEKLDKKFTRRAIESLDESATQSYHLMDNLLQWTRSQMGKTQINPEIFSVNELIRENIQFAQTALDFKGIAIQCDCDSEIKIFADKLMIKTVIRNLISNSIKFTPEKGQIFIKATFLNDKVEISIRDTGIGIRKEIQDTLFRKEATTSSSNFLEEKGSGIGLLLCKEFIDMHKGRINLTSTEGMGTEFIVSLPINEGERVIGKIKI